jgi:hypothetical protein
MYALLWLYLDHVISSNRGVSYSFYFPLQKTYWMSVFPYFFKEETKNNQDKKLKRKRRQLSDKDLGLGLTEEETLESVNKEME